MMRVVAAETAARCHRVDDPMRWRCGCRRQTSRRLLLLPPSTSLWPCRCATVWVWRASSVLRQRTPWSKCCEWHPCTRTNPSTACQPRSPPPRLQPATPARRDRRHGCAPGGEVNVGVVDVVHVRGCRLWCARRRRLRRVLRVLLLLLGRSLGPGGWCAVCGGHPDGLHGAKQPVGRLRSRAPVRASFS